jgi:hypothetical protein
VDAKFRPRVGEISRSGNHRLVIFALKGLVESSQMMVQSRFHKDEDGDLHEQILRIEAYIEELADVVESCRKIILVSKFAAGAGGILILAIIIGAIGFNATFMIGAITAVVGGTVVFGSNASTLKQTTTAMKAAEAHRAELISRMDLRVVGGGEAGSGQ